MKQSTWNMVEGEAGVFIIRLATPAVYWSSISLMLLQVRTLLTFACDRIETQFIDPDRVSAADDILGHSECKLNAKNAISLASVVSL